MQCNAMQCNAMQCNAMQCNAMQYNKGCFYSSFVVVYIHPEQISISRHAHLPHIISVAIILEIRAVLEALVTEMFLCRNLVLINT